MRHLRQAAMRALAVAALLASSLSFASAQQGLHMEIGFSERIEIPGTVANVVVGAPEIADVLPLTSNAYLLNAKQAGTTNIVAVDESGEVIYYARLVVRPVDIFPRSPVRVIHGTDIAYRYVCDDEQGCVPAGSEATRPAQAAPVDEPPEAEPAG